MAKRFTFKTIKPTGKWKSFHSSTHKIKLGKQVVGRIDDKEPYKIWLQVTKTDIMEDGNPNCPWKWIVLKKDSKSLQEAKDFVNAASESILSKYKLHVETQS